MFLRLYIPIHDPIFSTSFMKHYTCEWLRFLHTSFLSTLKLGNIKVVVTRQVSVVAKAEIVFDLIKLFSLMFENIVGLGLKGVVIRLEIFALLHVSLLHAN